MSEELFTLDGREEKRAKRLARKPWRLDCYPKPEYDLGQPVVYYYWTRWGALFSSLIKWQGGGWLYKRIVLVNTRKESES